jgi:hypothetical protein
LALRWRQRERRLEWSLCIIIPVPPASLSFTHVRIDGYVNRSDVARQALAEGREFVIKARAGPYTVSGIRADGLSVWNPKPTQPLADDRPNVFAGGAMGGVQLEPDDPLSRGKSYAVLLAKNRAWQPPQGVPTRPLEFSPFSDPEGQWQAHHFHIPGGASEDIEEWCVRQLERRLVDRPPRLEVMAPPVIAVDLDGFLKVRAGSEIILSITNDIWWDPVIKLHDFSKKTSQEFTLGGHPRFCVLGDLPPGRYGAYVLDRLDLDRFASLQFEVAADAALTIPTIILMTSGGAVDGVCTTPLLDPTASARWADLLAGRSTFHGIILPPDWRVSLRCKTARGREEVREGLDEAAFRAALKDCVQGRRTYACLDGGVFGSVEWQALPPSRHHAEQLPLALVGRLRWLRSTRRSSSLHAGHGESPLGINIRRHSAEHVAAPDRELVSEFIATESWPAVLLPQARSAALELIRHLQPTL